MNQSFTQNIYYFRLLTINVLGIHDLKSSEMICYMYQEGEAGKGPNEVGTFLNSYIESKIEK